MINQFNWWEHNWEI